MPRMLPMCVCLVQATRTCWEHPQLADLNDAEALRTLLPELSFQFIGGAGFVAGTPAGLKLAHSRKCSTLELRQPSTSASCQRLA